MTKTIKERLLEGVSENEKGCWIWNGAKTEKGYGAIHYAGKRARTHRIAYEVFVGPIPDGHMVCHSCDEPSCLNPSHLWTGSAAENTNDMVRKGRESFRFKEQPVFGKKHHNAKMDDQSVRSIRSSNKTQVELAEIYGVSQGTISKIQRGDAWKHITR